MKEHKHAAVLRAIADGVPLSEFEVSHQQFADYWESAEKYSAWAFDDPESWEVRRKQQFITVNGFKVKKPVDIAPFFGDEYFIPDITSGGFFGVFGWCGCPSDEMFLSRGLIHKTKEASIAHAKAMLGMDPESNHE